MDVKQRSMGQGATLCAARRRHEGVARERGKDRLESGDRVLYGRRDVGADSEEVRPSVVALEGAGGLVAQLAEADVPLGEVMPTPGLCRAGGRNRFGCLGKLSLFPQTRSA